MSVRLGPERFADWWPEGMPLFEAHWREVANWQDCIPLDVDVQKFIELERAGSVRAWTARVDGRLVGYLVALVTPHWHYRATLHAWVDVIYVVPDLRGTGLAPQLLALAVQDLEQAGVARTICHVKLGVDFSPMLGRLGFVETERNWERVR